MAAGQHIKNPFELVLEDLATAGSDFSRALRSRPRTAAADGPITVRRIAPADLREALREGWRDLGESRADVMFIGLIYAVAGIIVARAAFNQNLLPLVFPLVSGFALVGPLAAVGLYEISRRREQGETVRWAGGFSVLRSPSILAIAALGALLLGLLLAWVLTADAIYSATLGPNPPVSLGAFLRDVFGTPAGWSLIAIGVGVGAVFAVVAFAISVVSFPLLLDRPVGVYRAVGASLRAVQENPRTMLLWGLMVAALLVLGSIPALLGLIVVLPWLGHSTWRLYRKVVAPA